MATAAQIKANQENAARSTGPRTPEGKAKSRLNSYRHGMVSGSIGLHLADPNFRERSAEWVDAYRPSCETQSWAFDRLVSASLRIERCEAAMFSLIDIRSSRARAAWTVDRQAEVAKLGLRLAAEPAYVSRQLQTTREGCAYLIERWTRLGETLDANGDWTEEERQAALDLLGVAADLRHGRTALERRDKSDPSALRRQVAQAEAIRLSDLSDSLREAEEIEHRHAVSGASILMTPAARLIVRYERNAWRDYRTARKDLTAPDLDLDPDDEPGFDLEPDLGPEPEPPTDPEPEPEPEPAPAPQPATPPPSSQARSIRRHARKAAARAARREARAGGESASRGNTVRNRLRLEDLADPVYDFTLTLPPGVTFHRR